MNSKGTKLTATAVEKMKREAKKLGRAKAIPHHEALELVAQQHGFTTWKWVARAASAPSPGHPPVGTPSARSRAGNSTPAAAGLEGFSKQVNPVNGVN